MNLIDYVIIAVIILSVAFSVLTIIRNKKKGKTSCGCDCANCKGCACKTKEDKNSK